MAAAEATWQQLQQGLLIQRETQTNRDDDQGVTMGRAVRRAIDGLM